MKHQMAIEVRHCQLSDLAEVKIEGNEEDGREFVAICDKYLSHFCAPAKNAEGRSICPKCGEIHGGLMANLGFGVGIEWGLVHGEGHCSNHKCRWPYRGHHWIREEGKPRDEAVLTVHNMFLAYHPDEVSVRSTGQKIRQALRAQG